MLSAQVWLIVIMVAPVDPSPFAGASHNLKGGNSRFKKRKTETNEEGSPGVSAAVLFD